MAGAAIAKFEGAWAYEYIWWMDVIPELEYLATMTTCLSRSRVIFGVSDAIIIALTILKTLCGSEVQL